MKYTKRIFMGVLALFMFMQLPVFADELTTDETLTEIETLDTNDQNEIEEVADNQENIVLPEESETVEAPIVMEPESSQTEETSVEETIQLRVNNPIKEPKPVMVTEDKSARIGETIEHRLNGLDMTAPSDNAIMDFQFGFFSEYFMKNTEFESIEFPYITAKDVNGNPIDDVKIYFMVIYSEGRSWIKDPVSINAENQSASITRAEVQAWADENNNGEFPTRLYYLVSPEQNDRLMDATEISFHGDVVLTQRMANVETYSATAYYEFLQWDVQWVFAGDFNQSGSNAYKEIKGYQYMYAETSTVTFDTPNLVDMKPGDTFTLDFTLTNDSVIGNRVALLLETEGLELVNGEDNEKMYWYDDARGFRGRLITPEMNWHLLVQGAPVTVSQEFRIKEDFTGSQIKINAGLTAASVGHDYEFDNEFVINMFVPTTVNYAIAFESNGGSAVASIQDIAANTIVTAPTAPTKANFAFAGWYTNTELTEAFDFMTTPITENMTLYAKWNAVDAPEVVVPEVTTPETQQPEVITPDSQLPTTGSQLPSTGIGNNYTGALLLISGLGIVLLAILRKKEA
ncbi:hypothetical protein G7062_08415 [Erysipelothrix sp. HDW6C]|uniref:InlB B-repeat-containing protein n=1 Tax=Erysipelothrix sp. HDW6C TaxID=2714930 RepID=UPI00140BEBC2|nr:InlB B-repeat-containing protein [Erysipelothrix sp. HDW6C]QIK70315.1 hypothetical protein G7062_08415 [Erysipelothrix sp. HDW6C]